MNALGMLVLAAAVCGWWALREALRRAAIAFETSLACLVVISLNTGALACLGSLSLLRARTITASVLIAANLLAIVVSGRRLRLPRLTLPSPPLSLRPTATTLLASAPLFLLAVVLAQALVYSPTGYDSMAYHFPKVAHLIDTGSVSPFASHYPHVNETPWGYTYFVFFGRVAFGDGFFDVAGLIQFLGLCASLVMLKGVLDEVIPGGPGSRARMATTLALVLIASPMSVLQGASSRNDLVASAFTLTAVRGGVVLARGGIGVGRTLGGAALLAFGFAGTLAVKPNLAIQIVLLLAALFGLRARTVLKDARAAWSNRNSWRVEGVAQLRVGVLMVVPIGLLVLPFAQASASNLATYGKLTGPASDQILSTVPSPADAICRSAMTFGWESSVSAPARSLIERAMRPLSEIEQNGLERFSRVCGDERLAAKNNLTPGTDPFVQGAASGNEDSQPSALQFHVMLATALMTASRVVYSIVGRLRRLPRLASAWSYLHVTTGSALIALVAGSMATPWLSYSSSRFLLPSWLLVIALGLSTLVGAAARVSEQIARPAAARIGLGAVVALSIAAQGYWIAANNVHRPLPGADAWGNVSRSDDWRAYTRAGRPPAPVESISTVLAVAEEQGCSTVGVTDPYFWKFPLWLALRDEERSLVDVMVTNPTGRYETLADRNAVCVYFGPATDLPVAAQPEAIPVPEGWTVWLAWPTP